MLCVMMVQGTSVARVAAQQAGYFEITVAGKIIEPWVAFFWGYLFFYVLHFLRKRVYRI